MNIDFTRNLIKGRIVETLFEEMIRHENNYMVIPFGYEHTIPTLAQYHDVVDIPKIIDNISEAPDFVLISNDKTKVYLVEVKYQKTLDKISLIKYAEALMKRWEYPWLFVATREIFYCGQCRDIIKNGEINKCSDNWISYEEQKKGINLPNQFLSY